MSAPKDVTDDCILKTKTYLWQAYGKCDEGLKLVIFEVCGLLSYNLRELKQ